MSSVTNPRHSRDKMRARYARVVQGVLLNQCLHREVMASGYQLGYRSSATQSETDELRRRSWRVCRVWVERVASLTGSASGLVGVEGER